MKNELGVLKALSLLSQVGIAILIPIIIGMLLGNKLDDWLGTGALFLAVFVVLGVIVGFRNAYKLLMSQQD
ncbi:AtpZ/AtpI family protein [Natroniella sulfidigena]|uniref:AtpZ/AtpI family protein n=1 Tax=Natroniella sulfidigena TaxID=723921 RepID=UPI00200A8D4E|nr:AtpZ/AtpI family protein [Natroniella sulfidigena]MCK8816399.1 AtpZ/AtpI family protein [Natroniella sulfidigena]